MGSGKTSAERLTSSSTSLGSGQTPTDRSDVSADGDGWLAIDHVQLAIPVGGEDVAREFYVEVLGLVEVPKPPALAARGGAWFEAGRVQIHVGADEAFTPARKAHPALVRRELPGFVRARRLDVTWSDEIPGVVRCHVSDPFGNRIELIDASVGDRTDP